MRAADAGVAFGPGGVVVAVDLGGTTSRAALVAAARVVERREAPTPATDGPEAVVDRLAELVAPWHRRHGHVAVAATGRVHDGRVFAVNRTTMPGWDGYPLASALEARLGTPVTLLNDAHAAAWGEYRFGAGRGRRDFAFVTVSTGVGAGLVGDGRLLCGARGLAGHLGFLPLRSPHASFLEEAASGRAVSHHGGAALGAATSTADVFAAAEHDPRAAAVVEDAVAALADALVTLRWLHDPERVAVGGSVGLADGYLERLRRALTTREPDDPLEVVAAELGADAGLIGVAAWTSERGGAAHGDGRTTIAP